MNAAVGINSIGDTSVGDTSVGVTSFNVTFGSAHLLTRGMAQDEARALLEAAVAAGASRLDTAPLYGYGGSEGLVAAVSAAHGGTPVTTKVGLEPSPPPSSLRRAAGAVLGRLPAGVRQGLQALRQRKGGGGSQADGPSGRFGVEAVRRSIDRSLTRLGRIDRLMLHEVHPADIDDGLLELLRGYQSRGDVGQLGVATGNAVTLQALARSQGLFTAAHVSVDPLGVPWPDFAAHPQIHWVGHGVLGPEGRTLKALAALWQTDAELKRRWSEAVRGTPYEEPERLADALFAHATRTGARELVVATKRLARVNRSVQAAAGRAVLPSAAHLVISEALRRLPSR